MASQWFSCWERDRMGNWTFMGWMSTNYAAAQMLAVHLQQCTVFMQQGQSRYMIGDIRGDSIIGTR
jgi:hypothetical protein